MAELKTMGFGKAMERKLKAVGINSAEALREIGSRQAVSRLKERYPGTCVVILYYLEAAIQGVDIKELDGGCRAGLKEYFKQL